MDTARADIVSEPSVMPSLRAFAEDSYEFTNCFSNAPWTLPSHSSLFTGQRPSDHEVIGKGDIFESELDMVSTLNSAGYNTAAFSNNPWISPDFGFDSFNEFVPGWKRFRRGSDLAGISQIDGTIAQIKSLATELLNRDAPYTLANAVYMKLLNRRSDSGARLTTERLLNWMEDQDDNQPFFAFVNFMEPHLDYTPPEEYILEWLPDDFDVSEALSVNQDPWAYLVGEEQMGEKSFEILKSLYRAELSYLDDHLNDIFSRMKSLNILDESVVFVLGDHGENIGDHSLMDHQYSLQDTLLHVPLIVHYPKDIGQKKTFDGLVELRDIYPTMLDLAGEDVNDDKSVASKPLHTMVDEQVGREHTISEYPVPQPDISTLRDRYSHISTDLSQYDRGLWSIRTPNWRYIVGDDGEDELYEISSDGSQQAFDQGTVSKLRKILEEEISSELVNKANGGRDRSLPQANREHLEDLGYL